MSNPTQLFADAVRGRTDDEIEQGAAMAGGPKGMLDLLFEGMRQNLDPSAAEDSVIEWTINASESTLLYRLIVQDGTATLESKEVPKVPVVTLVASYADFMRIMAGDLDGMQAALQGRLQIAGDSGLAGRMGEFFKQT